ncbi:efflux RND transporter periplasmic adaptor subunit [bacterium]|nr:efflux RND transporter periplasmic adaptor subunit [bacterium]
MKARTASVVARDVPRLISVRGTIHAEDDAVLSSRAMGPVVRERAKPGDRVRKGDVLLEIEERMNNGMLSQATGALAQAQAAQSLAATNLRRFEALFDAQACSQLELDMARMQFETAEGAVKQARGSVDAAGAVASESTIRAPFDGVVVEKFVNVGDLVAPGRPLIRVQTVNGRKLHFFVRAADGAHLVAGTEIECTLDNSGKRIGATIADVSPSADPMTHTIAVTAQLNDADSLSAGHAATAEIPCETTLVVLASKSAVFSTGGLTLTTIVDQNSQARTRVVTTGRVRGDEIEILSGLKSGDIVVLDRSGLIAEGTRIERTNG